MIPRTKLFYNWLLSGIFNGTNFNYNKNKKEMKRIEKKCSKFEKLYNKHINKILYLIEKETNCRHWRIPFIPIYVINVTPKFNTGWKAISDPLLIKFISNPDRMFYILIHELVHLNEFKGHVSEAEVNKIDIKVYEMIRSEDDSIKLSIPEQIMCGKEESRKREIIYKKLNKVK